MKKNIPFFKTKFLIPKISKNFIKREAILKKLSNYLNFKFIFVYSPSGFGKTSILAQWVDTQKLKKNVIWISLDSNNNNLDNFFLYFIKSFESILKNSTDYELTNLNGDYEIDYHLSLLSNKLNELKNDLVIIFDDYHHILNDEIHNKLALFMMNTTDKLHFVFSGKNELPIAFINFKYKYETLEINSSSLLFTKNEIIELFSKHNFSLNDTEVEIIKNKTEGWSLSLKAIILALKEDYTLLIENLDNNINLFRFLLEEILVNLDKNELDFLLKTSILYTFNSFICNNLLDISNSQEIIDKICKKQLFINNIDNGNWYKYHNLFSEVLSNKLQTDNYDMYITLCKKSSEIFKEYEYNESIKFALLTKDNNFICDILSDLCPTLIKNKDYTKLVLILDKIPQEIILSKIKLSLYYSITLIFGYKINYAKAILTKIKTENINEEELALLNLANTIFSLFKINSIPEIKKYQTLTIEGINYLDKNIMPFVYYYLSISAKLMYDFEKSLIFLEESTLDIKRVSITHYINSISSKALILILQDRLNETELLLMNSIKYLDKHNLLDSKYRASFSMKFLTIYCEQGKIVLFDKYEKEVLLFLEKESNIFSKFQGYFNIAQYNLILGRSNKIENSIKIIEELDLGMEFKSNNIFYAIFFTDFKIYLNIQNENFKEIPLDFEIITKKYINNAFLEKIKRPYYIEILYSKVLLLVNFYIKKEIFNDSLVILNRMLELVSNISIDKQIRLLTLKVIIHNKQNKKSMAIEILKQTLILAEKPNYISHFILGGNDIKKLLLSICNDYKKRNINVFNTYAYTVLGHFNQLNDCIVNNKLLLKNDLNPLSKKEIEILKLMKADIKSKIIINDLKISINTFKTHTKNIYKKLGIKNKKDAVKKAIDLEFI